MHLNNRAKLLVIEARVLAAEIMTSSLAAGCLKVKSIAESASILVLVINKKVVKTKANFLTGWDICLYNDIFSYSYSI